MNSAESLQAVLILEDEVLIAMDLELMLNGIGFSTVVLTSTCKDALIWLEGNSPSFAILDVDLGNETCGAVAERLKSRSVPFTVCSGLPSLAEDGEALRDAVRIPKPTGEPDLVAALTILGITLPRLATPAKSG